MRQRSIFFTEEETTQVDKKIESMSNMGYLQSIKEKYRLKKGDGFLLKNMTQQWSFFVS